MLGVGLCQLGANLSEFCGNAVVQNSRCISEVQKKQGELIIMQIVKSFDMYILKR